jgi:hypothetical protein
MPVTEIVQILLGLLNAAPQLVNAITAAQASPDGIVPAATISAIFSKYGIDRAVLSAAIANAAAQGK